jgi:Cytochrome P460
VSPQSIHNQQLLNLRSLDQYFKVNDRPIELRKPSPPRPSDVPYGPHFANSSDRSFSNICVNAKARDIIIAGKGIYPVGSIVINVVSNTSDGSSPTLFTVMEKMAFGYDQQRGDWKYSIIDGRSYIELASGRIDSCIDCHSRYANTDFVSRTYLNKAN